MLLPRKWVLSLGLLATVPSIALAGPFDGKPKSNARPTAKASAQRDNDDIAQDVADGFKTAGLKVKGGGVVVEDGVATLTGQIASPEQLAKATQVASRVPGIEKVNNRLTSTSRAAAPARTASRPTIQQVQYEDQQPAAAEAGPSNQDVAQGVADELAAAGLSDYDITIRFKNGTCTLSGDVSNPAEVQRAQQAAENAGNVQQVVNRLTIGGQSAAPAQYARRPSYPNGLAVGEGQLPPGLPPQAMGQNPQIQQMQMQQMRMQQAQMQQMGGPGMDGSSMGAPGMGGYPQGGVNPAGHHMMYNQPNVPEYAWPTYAQYDNYAAVTYPGQYDASAFPYIGPFYPYPQVPLNWRQSTLEWKDGTWNLRFSTKTDKWFWFMSPKNWE